jgi:hypothetical protein
MRTLYFNSAFHIDIVVIVIVVEEKMKIVDLGLLGFNIMWVDFSPEDGDSMYLRKAGIYP